MWGVAARGWSLVPWGRWDAADQRGAPISSLPVFCGAGRHRGLESSGRRGTRHRPSAPSSRVDCLARAAAQRGDSERRFIALRSADGRSELTQRPAAPPLEAPRLVQGARTVTRTSWRGGCRRWGTTRSIVLKVRERLETARPGSVSTVILRGCGRPLAEAEGRTRQGSPRTVSSSGCMARQLSAINRNEVRLSSPLVPHGRITT